VAALVYAQSWSPKGAVLARSTSLAGTDLRLPAATAQGGPFRIPLPNHHFGRGVVTSASLAALEAVDRSLGEEQSALRRNLEALYKALYPGSLRFRVGLTP
jgi:hypothetical protein